MDDLYKPIQEPFESDRKSAIFFLSGLLDSWNSHSVEERKEMLSPFRRRIEVLLDLKFGATLNQSLAARKFLRDGLKSKAVIEQTLCDLQGDF